MLDCHLVLPTITWLEEVRDEKHLEFYDVIQHAGSLLQDLFSTSSFSIPARVLECAFPTSQGISLAASLLADTLRTSASMEALVNLLQDTQEDWRIRVGAAELLGEWGERTPIGVLSAVAVDPACHDLIRVAAVEALGKQEERIPLEPLILLLQDPDERVRISTVTALAATGKRLPVIPFLAAVHDSSRVRDVVIQKAQELTGQVASEPLLHALSDVNAEMRLLAATLLGSNIPRKHLLAILHDSDGHVRCAAITLSGNNIPRDLLVAALHDSEEKVRLAAITQMGKDIPLEALLMVLHESTGGMCHGFNAVDIAVEIAEACGDRVPLASLLEVLQRHDGTEDLPHTYTGLDPVQYQPDALWYKVMLVIRQSGRTVPLPTLIALAQERNMLARVFEIAIHFDLPLPIDLLLTGLFQPDDQTISDRAASMLGNLGESAPMMTLLAMACNPLADVEKRLAATVALLKLAPSVPTEPIVAALEEVDVTSRLYQDLVRLLVKCGVSVQVDVLLKALDRDLAYLFVRDGVPVKVEVLLEALDSPERALIHLGAQAPIEALLGMLRDDPQHESYLANYYDSNDSAREVLEHLFEIITVPQLQVAARHGIEDEHMALKVLGVLGKHAPIDLIKSILDDGRRDRWLRRQARLTLHRTGVLLPLRYFFAEEGLSNELVDYDFSVESYYPTELMTRDNVTIAQMRELGPQAPMQDLFAFFDAPHHDRDDYHEPVPETVVAVLHELAPYLSLADVVALLDHSNPVARRGAARILSAFAERAPINNLIAMLQNREEDSWVRFTIVQALSELHAYTPAEVLTTLLNDPDVSCDYTFSSHICDALKPWGKNIPLEPLLALIHRADSKVDRRPAISALGWLQERAPLDLLLTLLQSEDRGISDHALLALCSLGKDIPLDIVIPHLPGKTNLMGSDYVQAFVALGEDLPLARFFRIVDDQDDHARTWVIKALGDFAEAAPVQFVALAKDDVRPFVRVALMKALAKLGQDAPVDLALAALTDPHPDVRRQARMALLQLPVNPMLIPLEPLLAALQEQGDVQEPGYYRYESNRHQSELALLARCGARVPVAPLLALLGDLDPDVCENAASALYQTHPEAFGEVTQQAEAILRGAPLEDVFASRVQSRIARRVSLIEHATPEVLALLSDLLAWPYWQVRVEAATTLANIHRNIPDRAMRRLLELRLDPTSQAVREAADHALAEILSRENGMEDE